MMFPPPLLYRSSVIQNAILYVTLLNFLRTRNVNYNNAPDEGYHTKLARLLYSGPILEQALQVIHTTLHSIQHNTTNTTSTAAHSHHNVQDTTDPEYLKR